MAFVDDFIGRLFTYLRAHRALRAGSAASLGGCFVAMPSGAAVLIGSCSLTYGLRDPALKRIALRSGR
eukprot:102599-Heterocapsa_arctica.AAC.1